MRDVLTIADNEKYLRQKSKYVDLNDKDLPREIEDLKEYCFSNAVYAMAAVQIGIPKRIVFVKTAKPAYSLDVGLGEKETQLLLINPKIVSMKGRTRFWEGCQSALDYAGLVERPYSIVVKYQTLDGTIKSETFEGFIATVVSHEIDHLDGIFHMDRTKTVIKTSKEERLKLRNKQPYEILSKTCDFKYPPIAQFKTK